MRPWLPLLTVLFALPTWDGAGMRAEEEQSRSSAAEELSTEFSRCFAYYQFVTYCSAPHLSEQVKAQWTKIYETSSARAYDYGKRAGLSDQEVLAALEAAIDQLASATNKSCVEVPAITAIFGNSCRLLLEQPDEWRHRLTSAHRDQIHDRNLPQQ